MLSTIAKGVNYLFGGYLQKKKIFLSSSLINIDRKRSIDKNYFDYIRLATLEAISYEITQKGLPGNVAELGVYKGKFARFINFYFKDRKLYLFHTFESFDERDVKNEKEKGLSSGSQDFSATSVDSVLKIMPYPQNCIPVKGFFPESAVNIEDRFIYVNLDADLYEPVYAGLKFFYPRLNKGGYIFIHDFNNPNYKGARLAVETFCEENNIGFVPIPDSSGTAIIAK